jgi:hypothetical protein
MDTLRAAGRLSRTDADRYLYNVLATWPKSGGGLYSTYGEYSFDIYDNAVMALALMATDKEDSLGHPGVIGLLTFFSTKLETLASTTKMLLPNSFDHVDNPIDTTQDVGNNAWVGIALARFALQYPNHPNTKRYLQNAWYLVVFFRNKIHDDKALNPDVTGDFSTEHCIVLFAFGQLATLAGITDGGIIAAFYQTFVKSIFQEYRYLVGTVGVAPNESRGEYPVVCQTWKLLSGVDNQLVRDKAAMQAALDGATKQFSPGVAFAVAIVEKDTQCALYGVTGGAFAALNEFVLSYPDVLFPVRVDTHDNLVAAATLMRGWVAANTAIVAALTPSVNPAHYKNCTQGSCCSCIGLGQDYPINTMHLSATAWTVFGLAGMDDPSGFNPFQYRPHKPTTDPPGPGPGPASPCVSCVPWQIAVLVVGAALLMLAFAMVMIKMMKTRKKTKM